MSKYKTCIAVDVQSVIDALPPGVYLHGVEWNESTRQVEIQWEHDALKSGLDHFVDCPRESLTAFSVKLKHLALPDTPPTPGPHSAAPPVMTPEQKTGARAGRRK